MNYSSLAKRAAPWIAAGGLFVAWQKFDEYRAEKPPPIQAELFTAQEQAAINNRVRDSSKNRTVPKSELADYKIPGKNT